MADSCGSKQTLRILILNRYFDSQQIPTARMAGDVAVELHSRGHQVRFVASKSKYTDMEQATASVLFDVKYVEEFGRGRILNWGWYWIRALAALASKKWDRCLLLTDPPFLPFAAWLTRPFRRNEQRIYWWTMDIYPEALVAAGMLRERSFGNWFLRNLNELGLLAMNGVICLGQRQSQRLASYRNWIDCKAILVHPWDYRPIPRLEPSDNSVLERMRGKADKLAIYTGNLGEGHIYRPFVEVARWFQEQRRTDWKFVFVIRGSGRPELEKMIVGLPNFQIFDYFPEAETGALLWSATVHLVSMKQGWEGVIVPSKLYGAFQTAAPVLFVGPLDADTATEIKATGRGICLPPDVEPEILAKSLDALAAEEARRVPTVTESEPSRISDFIAAGPPAPPRSMEKIFA